MTLIDPLNLLYCASILNGFRETYEGDIKTIFDFYELNEKAKAIINAIQMKIKQKKGKERRENLSKIYFMKSQLFC